MKFSRSIDYLTNDSVNYQLFIVTVLIFIFRSLLLLYKSELYHAVLNSC